MFQEQTRQSTRGGTSRPRPFDPLAPVALYSGVPNGEKSMLSESARMTTAEEARFRIDYPNSRPRAIKVIALDEPAERVVKRLAQGSWQGATFLTALKFDGAPRGGEGWSMRAWLSDLAGRTKDLIDEVASADLMVMVA